MNISSTLDNNDVNNAIREAASDAVWDAINKDVDSLGGAVSLAFMTLSPLKIRIGSGSGRSMRVALDQSLLGAVRDAVMIAVARDSRLPTRST